MKKLFKTTFAAASTALLLLPMLTLAQGSSATKNPFSRGLEDVKKIGAGATGQATQRSLPEIMGSIINVVLGFLGIVFLILMLYAGFLWMTAQGDEKKVQKSIDMIKQAVVGLIVVIAAFAISNFVVGSLANVASGTV